MAMQCVEFESYPFEFDSISRQQPKKNTPLLLRILLPYSQLAIRLTLINTKSNNFFMGANNLLQK